MIVKGKGIGTPIRYVERASKEVEEEVVRGGGEREGTLPQPGFTLMVCKSRLCTLCSSEGEVRLVSGLLLASRCCLISRFVAGPTRAAPGSQGITLCFLSRELPSSKALPSRRCEGGNSCLASRCFLTIVSNSGYARRATSLSYFLYPIPPASFMIIATC
jgi:hypothetical protein